MLDDEQDSKQSFDIGYGRPPKASQFKKGQSGNVDGGRAHKKLTLQTYLNHALEQPLVGTSDGQSRRMSTREALVWKQLQAALEGKPRAVRQVLEYAKKAGRLLDPVNHQFIVFDPDYFDELVEYRELKAAGKDPWDYVDPRTPKE